MPAAKSVHVLLAVQEKRDIVFGHLCYYMLWYTKWKHVLLIQNKISTTTINKDVVQFIVSRRENRLYLERLKYTHTQIKTQRYALYVFLCPHKGISSAIFMFAEHFLYFDESDIHLYLGISGIISERSARCALLLLSTAKSMFASIMGPLPVCLIFCPCDHGSVCLSVWLCQAAPPPPPPPPRRLSFCLPVCNICLSVCLSVCVSACLPVSNVMAKRVKGFS